MKRILLTILIALSVCASHSQVLLKNKKYNLASVSGSSISVNAASDVAILYVYGTKTLASGFSIAVTGTPADGEALLMFYDGDSITTGGNTVTVFGESLTDKQATSKLIVLTIWRSSYWETRIFNDAKNSGYIGKEDLDPLAFDTTTIELDPLVGVQIKPGSITTTHIDAAAAIPYSKLVLTNSVVAADIAPAAAIPYSKLSLTGTVVNADMASGAAVAWNKMAALTATRVPYIDGSGVITASSVTPTELGYLSGVTANVQTQIDAAQSGKSYAEQAAATLVLDANAKDWYICETTSSTISVTLPDPADFDQGRVISFTRVFTGGSNAVTIQASTGSIEGSTGADVATYTLNGVSSGEGVEFISNGTDTWKFLRKW